MIPEERARGIAEQIVRRNTFVYGDSGQPGYFADIIPTIASALLAEREAATRAEREAVVTWLRRKAEGHTLEATRLRDIDIDLAKTHKSISHTCGTIADLVERSEHTPTDAGGGEG